MRLLLLLSLSVATAMPVWSQDSPSGAVSLEKSRTYLEQGRTEEAIDMLQKLATTQPAVKGVHHDLGLAYYRTGKLVEADREFAAAIAEDASDRESVQMEGLTLYRMGQPAKAIDYLERVRDWMPNADADSNHVLGLCYLRAQRYDDARAAFAREFGVEPGSSSGYLLMGSMLWHAELQELAAADARKALELDPHLPLAHFLLGEVYLYKSDVAHATQEFEAERSIDPAYAETYDRLGDVYTRAGKYDQAQQALTKAISLDVSSTGPFILMGKVLLHREDAGTALLYLRHAEKMDPSNYITHTLLSQAYRKTGKEDEAKRESDLASKLHVDGELTLQPVE